MPERKPRLYWDACIFIHYIEGTPRWLPILDALLDQAADRRAIEIYTSAISVTEVAFAQSERDQRSLSAEIQDRIDGLWSDPDVIRVIEYDRVIATAARDLVRGAVAEGRRLRPMDAIHLATARHWQVDQFQTTDGPLLSRQTFGFPIIEPHVLQPRLIE